MKFRVEREVLGEAVAWVARALPSRPVVPVLSGMLVRADAAGLTLSCFDYEVSAKVVVPAAVGEPGEALVPGRLLAEITRSLPAAAAEVSSAGDMLLLTCGSAEFSLVALALEEYPSLPDLPAVVGTVDGGALATAAAQVVPSSSRDDTLPMLTGVCMDIAGDQVTFAATDRYRLAVRTIGWTPADPEIAARALVPARTLADIAKTMSPGVPVTMAFGTPGGDSGRGGDGMISFEGGGRRLTARLIGGEFIRYESRFPAEFGSTADLPAAQFTDAVRRVSLVADRTSPVRLTFRPDTVLIEARSDGRARGTESVPVRFGGSEQAIAFNPHYLLDGLAAATLSGHDAESEDTPAPERGVPGGRPPAPAAERGVPGGRPPGPALGPGWIRLEFTSPAKPALITWAGAGEQPAPGEGAGQFRYLVVPLRVPATA